MSLSSVHTDSALRSGLRKFQADVNGHPQMQKVLRGWEPAIAIECSDAPEHYTLLVRDRQIVDVAATDSGLPCDIRVRGGIQVLTEIFAGALSPVTAYDEGQLQIFASDRDQIKIDTISLILWGV